MVITRKIKPINIKELSRQSRDNSGPVFPMNHFIQAGDTYTTPDNFVPAPYFRRVFSVEKGLISAKLLVTGLGLYEAYCNAENITKGPLAPYRSNPDHLVYFDCYDLVGKLKPGKNVMAFLVGVGLQSSVHPKWRWSELPWRSSVQIAFSLTLGYESGEKVIIRSDTETKTNPSPIYFNDYHLGEYYDARQELPGWNAVEFDDSDWKYAQKAPKPRGEPRLCEAEPIGYFQELEPKEIIPYENGFIYDFGINTSGVCRLCVSGTPGQKIVLQHFERMLDGKPFWDMISVRGLRLQEDEYICGGNDVETWMPKFTYHGFRYVLVTGITHQQATRTLLRYIVMHSDLKITGSFSCDNDMINRLQSATVCADWSNFFYFPTDCPHREKHGWTADASLSAEQMLCNFDPINSWRQWLQCVYRAMTPEGKLPGIIPTGGTNYDWGNGPAWDGVIAELPYQAYRYRGNIQIVREAEIPLMRYLIYLTTKQREDGLICFGLGDWCDVDAEELFCNTPLIVTDSILSVDIARKAAYLFGVLGRESFQQFAEDFADRLTAAIRRELIDHENYYVYGDTQSTQAMAMYYGMFTPEEFDGAMTHLLELIREKDGHFATGVLGGRVLFRLLAENGYAELACNMIIREDPPSYGNLICRGATALWEEFNAQDPPRGDENHHFWGDISAWFYRYLGGIRPNPDCNDVNRLDIVPCFVKQVNRVAAQYRMPAGEVSVTWERQQSGIMLILQAPKDAVGTIILPAKYSFDSNKNTLPLQSGVYWIHE